MRQSEELRVRWQYKRAKGPFVLRITLFNGSSFGIIQSVLEQDVVMHDVLVGVEHRLRSNDLQECLKFLSWKGFWVAADDASRPVKVKKQHGTLLEECWSRLPITLSR